MDKYKPTSILDLKANLKEIELSKNTFKNKYRIFVISNFTIDHIRDYLSLYGYKLNYNFKINICEKDQVLQTLIQMSSEPDSFNDIDLVFISLDIDSIFVNTTSLNWSVEKCREYVDNCLSILEEKFHKTIIITSFLLPDKNLVLFKDIYSKIFSLNNYVEDFCKIHDNQFYILDINSIVRNIGINNALNDSQKYISRMPFTNLFLNELSYELVQHISQLVGYQKKCLILDCDNTLWGGVVGEIGMHSIDLNPDFYPGNIYFHFQEIILSLINMGMIVCLCSKNNEEDVFDVLDNHPHMLLKKKHIVSHRINWNDKSTNITSIVEELNISLESVVFIDDSMHECELVKSLLPDVCVLNVPTKRLTLLPKILLKNYFSNLLFTVDDIKKTERYRIENSRNQQRQKFFSKDEFLMSLDMKVKIYKNPLNHIDRLCQLTQKTNQFNFSTKRYSKIEIEYFINNKETTLYSAGLSDHYGNYGIVGLAIIQNDIIDTLLISCRALGKNFELIFPFLCIESQFTNTALKELFIDYIPTKRNKQLKNYWENLDINPLVDSDLNKKYKINKSFKISQLVIDQFTIVHEF